MNRSRSLKKSENLTSAHSPTRQLRQKATVQIGVDGSVFVTDAWDANNIHVQDLKFTWDSSHSIGLVTFGILHGEEIEVSGTGEGAGAFYVHGCALRCSHCYQPEFYDQPPQGFVSCEALVKAMLDFQKQGVRSILFVVSHFQEAVFAAIEKAKSAGLSIPIAYKYSGLMSTQQLRRLMEVVDIFVPDIKAVYEKNLDVQSLPRSYGVLAKQGLKYLVDARKRVIIRYLWVPQATDHAGELRSILSDCAGVNVTVSLLTEFQDPRTKTISRMPLALRNACIEAVQQSGLRLEQVWTRQWGGAA